MRTRVGQPVAVRWPATEEAVTLRGQGLHGRADAYLDAGALALGEAAKEIHHEVMCLGPGVDGTTHLGHPQPDAVVREQGKSQGELAAVKGARRLTDDDRFPTPSSVGEILQQAVRLGPTFPGEGP